MRALIFIVDTLIDLYILTFILRLILQYVRADFHNPLSQFVVRVTNPLVAPLRRLIPSFRGLDLATLVAIIALEVVAVIVLYQLQLGVIPGAAVIAQAALTRAILAVLRLYFFVILITVILSWVSPGGYNPIIALLNAISEPVLRPARRLLPPIGGLDLSPLFVLLALQAVMLLVPPG